MKSHIDDILAVYQYLHKDIGTQLIIPSDLDRSFRRLVKVTESRGVTFLLVTLPELGKWFDHCLALGYTVDMPIQGIKMNSHYPLMWGELFSRVFDTDGTLLKAPCVDSVFFLRSLCYLAKKYKDIDCTDESKEKTLVEFHHIDSTLPQPRSSWLSGGVWAKLRGNPLYGGPDVDQLPHVEVTGSTVLPLEVSWESLRILSARILCRSPMVDVWAIRPKHGPGAVTDLKGKSFKYDFPHWPDRLEEVFPFDWFGGSSLDQPIPSNGVMPAKLICVPKSYKGPRLICSEMVADQWIQGGILGSLKETIKSSPLRHAITLHSQYPSRERAIQASLDQKFCTIDLSSASDRISANLVEYIFGSRQDYLDMFRAVRNGYVRQDLTAEIPVWFPVRKFSTQGSALTFPVQSILFAILTAWAICLDRKKSTRNVDLNWLMRQVTVFGDDIIIPNDCFETASQVLTTCGLRVNAHKSFNKGNFRESCGMDAFMGYDVTPAYYTRRYTGSPESTAATLQISNNFFLKGLWGVSDFISKGLQKKVPVNRVQLEGTYGKFAPHLESSNDVMSRLLSSATQGGQGLSSFVGSCSIHLQNRWNKHTHQWEYKMLSLISKKENVLGTGFARLSQNYFEIPADHLFWEAGSPGRTILRTRMMWGLPER